MDGALEHDVFEVGTSILCKKRSANALTCDHPVESATGGTVFVKVAPLNDPRADSILVDAANSLIVRRLDPHSVWSVRVRGINRCVLRRTDAQNPLTNIVIVGDDAEDATRIAMSFDVVTGSTLSSARVSIARIMRGVRNLLHNMIHYSSLTGMTHNDMHCGNVMMNEFFELRVIDYGRLQFGNATLSAHNMPLQEGDDFGAIDDILSFASEDTADMHVMSTWADPFQQRRATDAAHEHLYWMADVITFSMNVFVMACNGARSLPGRRQHALYPSFLMGHTMFRAQFRDEAALKRGLDALDPAFDVLKPGMALFAIVLKEHELSLKARHGYQRVPDAHMDGLFYEGNFTVKAKGGRVLHGLFESGKLTSTYGVLISSLFNRAGLWPVVGPAWRRHLAMRGGSGELPRPPPLSAEYLEDDDATGLAALEIAPGFPRSLEEAAEEKFRKQSSTHPGSQAVQAGVPWHVGGGGASATLVHVALAAVVAVASLMPR